MKLVILFCWMLILVACKPRDKVKSIPDELGFIVDFFKPQVELLGSTLIPKTIGSCEHVDAPAPCREQGVLYSKQGFMHKADVHWVSGLNDFKLHGLEIKSINHGRQISLFAKIEFVSMPVRLEISLCGLGGCVPMLDNSVACCGDTPKEFSLQLTMDCNDVYTPTKTTYLTNAVLDEFKMDTMPVTQKIFSQFAFTWTDLATHIVPLVHSEFGKASNIKLEKMLNQKLRMYFGSYPLICKSLKFRN